MISSSSKKLFYGSENFYSKNRKRVGRGIGSGKGKTSGKGHKGQRSRAGALRSKLFEGGQQSIFTRLPKRGFTSFLKRKKCNKVASINIRDINYAIASLVSPSDIVVVDLNFMKKYKIINKITKYVKLLSCGSIDNFGFSIVIYVNFASKVAESYFDNEKIVLHNKNSY